MNVKPSGLFFSKQLPDEPSNSKYVMSADRAAPNQPLLISVFWLTRLLFAAGSACGGDSVQLRPGTSLTAVHQPRTPIPTKPLFSTTFFEITWSDTPSRRTPAPGGRPAWKLPGGAGFGNRLLSRMWFCSITQLFI